MLVREALKRAKEKGETGETTEVIVIVLGHKDYYPRFGFERADEWNISTKLIPDVPKESFMVLELEEGALNAIRAENGANVIYSKAFT